MPVVVQLQAAAGLEHNSYASVHSPTKHGIFWKMLFVAHAKCYPNLCVYGKCAT